MAVSDRKAVAGRKAVQEVLAPDARRHVARELVTAIRPKQWLKNLLVVAAPAAGGVLLHASVAARTAVAVVAFCLVSSSMYLVNDVTDAEADRLHPLKRDRPVASGRLAGSTALVAAAGLIAVGGGLAATLGWRFVAVVASYVGLTVAYSLWLKRQAVLDIAAVALGFVLRAVAGGVAAGVHPSQWFLILTSFGALFVVAGKRSADQIDGNGAHHVRGFEYPASYLRYVWMLSSAVAIAAYCLWAFSSPQAMKSPGWAQASAIPFVLAILRYGLLLEAGRGGAPEELLLRDRPLELLVALWLVMYMVGVYVVG